MSKQLWPAAETSTDMSVNSRSFTVNGERSVASAPYSKKKLELHIEHELAGSRQVSTSKTIRIAARDHGVTARITFGN